MILAAGLSPAWQQILRFERFQLGQVNRAAEAVWCASGKVLNVGIALHHLGAESKTLAVLGGPNAAGITVEFSKLGVPHRWIASSKPTRVCTTILDEGAGSMTELVENAPAILPAELDDFRAAFLHEAAVASVVVISGSLPQGVPVSLWREMTNGGNAKLVLDIRGPELLECLTVRPFVVKPNREELSRTFGEPMGDDKQLLRAIARLHELGAGGVVITQGRGPVWLSFVQGVYRLDAPVAEHVVNPIGCGDCLAAGIAKGIEDGLDLIEATRLGLGAANDNLRQLLPSRLDPGRVADAAERVAVTRVL